MLTPFTPPKPPSRFDRWLLGRFAATLTIDVSPDGLRIHGDRSEQRVSARGSDTRWLFDGSADDSPSPYDRLVTLLRDSMEAAIRARHGRRPMVVVRPDVIWRGVASLDGVLHGYQALILERATYQAGARYVAFDPPLGA